MKRLLIFVGVVMSIFIMTGCNSIEEKKAEKAINAYYDALIDEDYDKAFSKLYLFDDKDAISDGTKLSNEDAKKFFLSKMDFIEKQNYKITDFKILEVEYEDGHSFWHHVEVTGEQNGEAFTLNEVVDLHDGKLVISSTDPYVDYRNGNMTIDLKK